MCSFIGRNIPLYFPKNMKQIVDITKEKQNEKEIDEGV